MSNTNTSEWFRNNVVSIVIALLLSVIGWGGNEAFQFFKTKFITFEQWRIDDIEADAVMESRVTKLEYKVEGIYVIPTKIQ